MRGSTIEKMTPFFWGRAEEEEGGSNDKMKGSREIEGDGVGVLCVCF